MKALPSPVLQAHQVDGFDVVVCETRELSRRRPPMALTVLTIASLGLIALGLADAVIDTIAVVTG